MRPTIILLITASILLGCSQYTEATSPCFGQGSSPAVSRAAQVPRSHLPNLPARQKTVISNPWVVQTDEQVWAYHWIAALCSLLRCTGTAQGVPTHDGTAIARAIAMLEAWRGISAFRTTKTALRSHRGY